MTTVSVENMAKEIFSFTLREDIEIEDLKETIALYFKVNENRIVLYKDFIECKDYFEVVNGSHFHLFINDMPHYTLCLNNSNIVINHFSKETIMIFDKDRNKWNILKRHLLPDQPYVLYIEKSTDIREIIIESLRNYYNSINTKWHLIDNMNRIIAEEEKIVHVPKENKSIFLFQKLEENLLNFKYLIEEFTEELFIMKKPFSIEV